MNLTVRQRIWGGFICITLLLVLIGINSLVKINSISDSANKVSTLSIPALTSSSKLKVSFTEMQSLAIQAYYLENKEQLNNIESQYKDAKKHYNSAFDELVNTISEQQELRVLADNIKQSYNQFEANVKLLFDNKEHQLGLRAQMNKSLDALDVASEDASTIVLDLSDEGDLENNDKRSYQAASGIETAMLSIISNSSDLVISSERNTVEALTKEVSYAFADVERNFNLAKPAFENISEDMLNDLAALVAKVKTLSTGPESIAAKKAQLFSANDQATNNLEKAKLDTKKAISQLEDLVSRSNKLVDKLQSNVESEVSSAQTWTLVGILFAIVIAIIIAFITVQKITKPLGEVNSILELVAAGDMTNKLDDSSKDEFGELAKSCNRVIENLRNLIQGIISRSTQLAAASEQTSTITQESSTAIESQRAQVEQAATATTEMTSTSQAVEDSAQHALTEIKHADHEAERVKGISAQNKQTIEKLAAEVSGASNVINKLHEDSASIGRILDVIRGIAEQTNLLALNAAIEAARAGEQGRGFAVVADEVRSLASKTQESTQEIQAMITSLQAGAEEAVSVMSNGQKQADYCVEQSETASQALEAITVAVSQAHDASDQIAIAAQEQRLVSQEISERLESIVAIAEQTAEGAKQTSTSSEEVAKLAEELRQSVEQFKV